MTPARNRRPTRRPWVGALTAGVLLGAAMPAGAGPPIDPHVVTSQPQTDGVVLEGYAAGVPVSVQVIRGGVVIGTSQAVTPAPVDLSTLAEINSAGGSGVCWKDATPDIVHGDVIRTIQNGVAEDARVQNVTVEMQVDANNLDTVTVSGTARTPTAQALPASQVEAQLSNQSFSGGRPFIRSLAAAAPPQGSGNWIATFSGLIPADHAAAVAAAASATWTSDAGTEATEVEFNPAAIGGPQGTCSTTAMTEGITSITPLAYLFDSTSLTIGGVAASDATAVTLAISDANPVTADVVAQALVQTSGGGKFWNISLPGSAILPLTDGALTITPTFNPDQPSQRIGTSKTITKNMVPPDLTAPVASIVSGPKAVVRSTIATFDLASTEPGTLQCRLDAAPFAACSDPTILVALARGPHTFIVRAIDGAGNIGPEVRHAWTIDLTGPRVTASISAARRALLTRTGALAVAARCNERCTVTVEAKFVMPGGTPIRARIVAKRLTIAGRVTSLARARLSRAHLGAIQRSLRSGKGARVFLNVTAVDGVGNRTAIRTNTRLTARDLPA